MKNFNSELEQKASLKSMTRMENFLSAISENLVDAICRNRWIKYINSIVIHHPAVYPLHLFHVITLACNASCPFCYLQKRKPEPLVDFETLASFLDRIGHVYCLQLQGGETFLYRDLIRLTETYISKNNCRRITLITNGSLPQESVSYAKHVLGFQKKVRLIFYVSIDDLPENHDRIRGISDLSLKAYATACGLRSLRHPRLEINGIICIHKGNIKNIHEILQYLRNRFPFDNIICTLQRKERNRVVDFDISSLTKSSRTFKEYNYYKQLDRVVNGKDPVPCLAGRISCTLMPDGKVMPCELMPAWFQIDQDCDLRSNWRKNYKRARDLLSLKHCQCSLECQLGFNFFHDPGNWIPLLFSYFDFYRKRLWASG